ncbi:hypothetical protein BHE90_002752 [Fusarium euwallaceae]|uniref:Transcription factor domain-containing protein n=1 Tax=Fusarium euwallaceae TaxID=1147111 RepID=A0A430M419_9HYPO|nr:hypothetical protein BHE90_002752 [Fusarium euwallaceae]
MPTALVEHWFRYICPTRSTFDSETNYNRRLACNTWSTSEAVFYTLQAMSAAYSMPHVSKDLRAQAVAAVDHEVTRIRGVQSAMVTVDLVFAVFKLGTSLSGTPDAGEHSWSELAHELLTAWGMQLSAADVLLHAYFCQALTYWEMVLAAIGGGSIIRRVERKRWKYEASARRKTGLFDDGFNTLGPEHLPYNPGLNLLGTRPNSWCGISNEVIDLFGQVLALCRTKVRGNHGTTINDLYDISLAREFQRELLAMDFDTLVLMDEVNGYFVETRDDKTPISHLLQTAEAYRQAALLQLHLAFNHLSADTTPRADFLLGLVLRLLRTLEQIPLNSGSRTIHPMLYLSAADGLRYLESSEPCALQLEISRAKRLVSSRLMLLPNHASGGTLQFVKSVWRQYEADRSWAYWRNVLEELGSGLHL